MTYNIHPIIVHFPIALLFFYSLIKILPVTKWFPKTSWVTTERFLLVIGTIGIFLGKSSGEIAAHMTQHDRGVLQMHEVFANATTWFYVALVIIEFLPLVISFFSKKKLLSEKIINLLRKLSVLIKKKWLVILLSILGLIALFITGLLGGVMVYGETADPIAPIVLQLLGL